MMLVIPEEIGTDDVCRLQGVKKALNRLETKIGRGGVLNHLGWSDWSGAIARRFHSDLGSKTQSGDGRYWSRKG